MNSHFIAVLAIVFVSLAFSLGVALGRSVERQIGKKDDPSE